MSFVYSEVPAAGILMVNVEAVEGRDVGWLGSWEELSLELDPDSKEGLSEHER